MPIILVPPPESGPLLGKLSIPAEELRVTQREILVDANLGLKSDIPELFPQLKLKDDLGQVRSNFDSHTVE
jgi:hypothetical protein